MKIYDYHQLLKRIDSLIRRSATGTPQQLANKIGKSRATVYRFIQYLKDLGAKVLYCRERRSFIYEEVFELKF